MSSSDHSQFGIHAKYTDPKSRHGISPNKKGITRDNGNTAQHITKYKPIKSKREKGRTDFEATMRARGEGELSVKAALRKQYQDGNVEYTKLGQKQPKSVSLKPAAKPAPLNSTERMMKELGATTQRNFLFNKTPKSTTTKSPPESPSVIDGTRKRERKASLEIPKAKKPGGARRSFSTDSDNEKYFKLAPKRETPISPKANPLSPKTDPFSPKADPFSPKANPISPKANPISPKANSIPPKAEKSSANNEKSEGMNLDRLIVSINSSLQPSDTQGPHAVTSMGSQTIKYMDTFDTADDTNEASDTASKDEQIQDIDTSEMDVKHSSGTVNLVSSEECEDLSDTEDSLVKSKGTCCKHKDLEGRQCSQPSLPEKRLCQEHFNETRKIQVDLSRLPVGKPPPEGTYFAPAAEEKQSPEPEDGLSKITRRKQEVASTIQEKKLQLKELQTQLSTVQKEIQQAINEWEELNSKERIFIFGSIAPEPLLQDDASAAASGNAETQAAHTTGTPEQSISPPALPKQLARECDPSPIQLQPAPITAPSPSAGSMRTIHHFPRILVTNPGPYQLAQKKPPIPIAVRGHSSTHPSYCQASATTNPQGSSSVTMTMLPATVLETQPNLVKDINRRIYQPKHRDSVLGLKTIKNFVISCSQDRSCNIFKIPSGHFVTKFSLHKMAVTALDVVQNAATTYLISGGNDCRILYTNLSENLLEKPLVRKTRCRVTSLKCLASFVVVGLLDGFIQIFHIKNNYLDEVPYEVCCFESDAAVSYMDGNSDYFALASSKGPRSLIYCDTKNLINHEKRVLDLPIEITDVRDPVLSLQMYDNDKLVSSTSTGEVFIHNLKDKVTLYSMKICNTAINQAALIENSHLICACMDGSVKCYSLQEKEIVGSMSLDHVIYRFVLCDNTMYYGDDDGHVGDLCVHDFI